MTPEAARAALDHAVRLLADARDAGTIGTREDRRRVRPVAARLVEALTRGDGVEVERTARKLARRAAGTPFADRVGPLWWAVSATIPAPEHDPRTPDALGRAGTPSDRSSGRAKLDAAGVFAHDERGRTLVRPQQKRPDRGKETR